MGEGPGERRKVCYAKIRRRGGVDAGGELGGDPGYRRQGQELDVRRGVGDDPASVGSDNIGGSSRPVPYPGARAGVGGKQSWTNALIWGVLCAIGMVGSAIIGSRAGREVAVGDAARSAGIRVFLFWLAVLAAAFLVPLAAGMWNSTDGANIPRVAIGIVALGYVLFGIMHRPAIAAVGVGIAAAFYIPSYLAGYLAGDASLAVTAGAIMAVVVLGWAWIRRSGEL